MSAMAGILPPPADRRHRHATAPSLLYQIAARDHARSAPVARVLLAMALLACAVLLRRALRVEPVQALRGE